MQSKSCNALLEMASRAVPKCVFLPVLFLFLTLLVGCVSQVTDGDSQQSSPLSIINSAPQSIPQFSSKTDDTVLLNHEECLALVNQAIFEYQDGNGQQAWLILQSLYDANCELAELHVGFGAMYEQMEAFEKAFAAFDFAVKTDPSLAAAHNNRGRIYAMMGRLDEAMIDFQNTLQVEPENARAHFNIGAILAEQNQFELALKSFRSSAELNYLPAHQSIQQVEKMLSSAEPDTSNLAAYADPADEQSRLVQALVSLSKFAYANLGPDRRLEVIERARLFGLGTKTGISEELLWKTTIEELHEFNKDGYSSSPTVATLELIQNVSFLVRVKVQDEDHFELSLWNKIKIDDVDGDTFNKQEAYTVTIEFSELELHLNRLLQDDTLYWQNGLLELKHEE